MMVHHLLLLGGCLVLLAAAAHDLMARTIPNAAPAAVAAAGLAARLGEASLDSAFAVAVLVFLCGMVLWRAGLMGGGDVKLLAASSLLLRPALVLPALVAISAAGALLAIPYIAARGRVSRPQPGGRALPLVARAWRAELFRLRRGGPVPYGAAIAAGVIAALWAPVT